MFEQTITVRRAARKTLSDRTTVPDWDNVTDTTVAGMNVQPLAATEDVDVSQRATTETFRVYSRPWQLPDVQADDRVVWGGVVFEVVGPSQTWPDPVTGKAHHVVFIMRRWTK